MNFNLYCSRYFLAGTAFGLILAAGIYYCVLASPLDARAEGTSPPSPEPPPPVRDQGEVIEMERVSRGPGEREGEIPLSQGLLTLFQGLSAIYSNRPITSPLPAETSPLMTNTSPLTGTKTPEYLPNTSGNLPKTSYRRKETSPLPETSLIPLGNLPPIPADFTHSPDFRSVWKRGRKFELTLNQSLVIQKYFEGFESRVPEIHQQAVLVDLGIGCTRIKDVFRKNLPAYHALFTVGERKGTLRLNRA